jgi:hypothetical protein
MLIGGRVAVDGGFVSLIPLGRAVAREGVRLAANRPPGGCPVATSRAGAGRSSRCCGGVRPLAYR